MWPSLLIGRGFEGAAGHEAEAGVVMSQGRGDLFRAGERQGTCPESFAPVGWCRLACSSLGILVDPEPFPQDP